jgi:hypothetical protein
VIDVNKDGRRGIIIPNPGKRGVSWAALNHQPHPSYIFASQAYHIIF